MIWINDKKFPYYEKGSGQQTHSSVVDALRNYRGVMIGSKIRDDIVKIELSWVDLSPEEWSWIQTFFHNNFINEIRYRDSQKNAVITKIMYPGDRTTGSQIGTKADGSFEKFDICKVNLIEV